MEMLNAYKKEFSSRPTSETKEGALKEFLSAGFPTPKTEDWRYADLKLLRTEHLKRARAVVSNSEVSSLTDWPKIVIENGQITEFPKGLDGVKVIEQSEDLEARGLFKSPLERLNLAFAERTFALRIEKGNNLPGLEVNFVNTSKKNEALYLRNLIEVEEDASANILVRTDVKSPGTWTNQITNITLGKNSSITLTRDFDAPDGALITARDFATIETGATFKAPSLLAGLSSVRYEVEAALLGKKAHADLSGGMLAGENETIDVLTRVHHCSSETTSKQTFKGVAGSLGSTAFQGRVRVEKDAQKIEAHQNCHNLILERTGEANVKPELLIFADDVICSHGATVGEVDEDALFYLMQRGISGNEARGLLVQAFLGELLEGIEDEKILTHFETKIENWMAENLK